VTFLHNNIQGLATFVKDRHNNNKSAPQQQVCSLYRKKKSNRRFYRLGAAGGRYRRLTNFKATFSTFLNEDEGKEVYNSAITFEVVPIEFRNKYLSVVKPQNVDFVCLPTLPCVFALKIAIPRQCHYDIHQSPGSTITMFLQ
jgi:hypothetical protein